MKTTVMTLGLLSLAVASQARADGFVPQGCTTTNGTAYDCYVYDTPGLKVLNGPTTIPIRIATSGVTLDCQDNSICAGSGCPAAPVEACDGSGRNGIWIDHPTSWVSDITIQRCGIYGWDAGVRAGYASTVTINDNTVLYNWDGLDLNQCANLDVHHNQVAYSGGQCTRDGTTGAEGDGLDLDLIDGSAIHDNWVYGNKDKGISLGNLKKDCGSIYRNNNNVIAFNSVYDNVGRGINVKATSSTKINQNWVYGNGDGAGKCKENECCDSTTTFCLNKDGSGNVLSSGAFSGTSQQTSGTCP